MLKQVVYFRENDEYGEIGVEEEGILQRYYRIEKTFFTDNIYVGKVVKVAKDVGVFVDIGLDKDGLLRARQGLKSGDYVLVQVKKEPSEEKGCELTEEISLSGRYAVAILGQTYAFSRKIQEEGKQSIKNAVKTDGNIGFIFRSACQHGKVQDIAFECQLLKEKLNNIVNIAKNTRKITLLFTDTVKDVAYRYAYDDENVTSDFTAIEEEINNINRRKIEVGGVEMVFDKTEALTAIDVNFHKFDKKGKSFADAVFVANKIAVKEIARQIRLRNIGGLIIIDYISMKENNGALKEYLEENLACDNVKTHVDMLEDIGVFAVVRRKRYQQS